MNYLVIFLKEENLKQKNLITDFLKGLLGASVNCIENKELVVSYREIEEINFKEIANILTNDFSTNLTLLEIKCDDVEYINVLIDLYYQIEISTTYLTEKKLLLLSNKLNNDLIKKSILKKYYNDIEMQNIIKVFLECDLNTSIAATKLYLHRNTLINKIDKFINETGYDVKKFKEAFIVYKVL